jgi:predicted ATPase/DNA-binding CsgD family transcriptional regulator
MAPLPPLDWLVRRDREVEEVRRRLAQWRVVTLTGPAGVGKSRLALDVAGTVQAAGAQDAVVVGVERLSDDRQVAEAVADALDEAERRARQRGPGAPEALLVVLDDCDRLVSACAQLAHSLLGRGVQVLATAREPLRVAGECVWRLAGLTAPERGQDQLPELLTEFEASQLFCEQAAAAARGFIPTSETAPAIAEICRRLDGIPLAIELAALTATAYSPLEILAHLENPFSLLGAGPRTVHPRHQSLRACLAWSYDLLSVPERLVLERLAVFRGAFSDDAAFQVCAPEGVGEAAMAEILRALVDKSLVEAEAHAGATRYRLLNMTRWFGAEKLAASGEEDALRDAHAQWCARFVQAAGDPRRGRPWLKRLEPIHDDLHAARERALERGPAAAAVVIGEADVRLCRAEGFYAEARVTTDRVVAQAANAPDAVSLAFVKLLAYGDSSDLGALVAMVSAARETAEPPVLVDALVAVGQAHVLVGDPAAAQAELAECFELARTAGDELGEAEALVGLGAARVALGSYGDAEVALSRGLELARALGQSQAVATALAWLGEAARLCGDAGTAERWFSEAADVARASDHPLPLTRGLVGLGQIAMERGDLDAAKGSFDAAYAVTTAAPLAYMLAACLCGMARTARDPVRAESMAAQALEAAQRHGDVAGETLALDLLGRLRRARNDVRGATVRHRQALEAAARTNDPAAVSRSLEALAGLAASRGEFSVSARLLAGADALRNEHGCVRPPSQAAEHAATVESTRGALEDEAFATEWSAGAALSTQTVVAYAASHRGQHLPRPVTGLAALTSAQRQVADLAVAGSTNADIAAALGIAPTTVKAHLRTVFAKVGVKSRTALAAQVHRSESSLREPM